MSMIIGLDFGTSTTVFSNAAGIITLFGQDQLIPSVALHLADSDEWFFGKEAIDKGMPDDLVTNLKSAITQNLDLLCSRDGKRVFDADDAITRYLGYLADQLRWDQQFGTTAVRMSCPAFWSKGQRQRLLRCATNAGFQVVRNVLLDEPVAAAVGWFEQTLTSTSRASHLGKTVMVFDMGGGTLDLALVKLSRKTGTEQEVLYQVSASCSSDLAGNAIDEVIARRIYDKVAQSDIDISTINSVGGVNFFLVPAREIKEALSVNNEVSWYISLPGNQSISFEYSRVQLKRTLIDVFESDNAVEPVIQSIVRALRLAAASRLGSDGTLGDLMKISPADLASSLDGVLLVGGMARMPILRDYVLGKFGDSLGNISPEILPEDGSVVQEVVALGLGQVNGFSNLNMMRPDFDIILRLYDAREQKELGTQLIWEAYSMPFTLSFDPSRPAGFLEETKYINFPAPLGYNRGRVSAEVQVVSHDGTRLQVAGASTRGFHLKEDAGGRIKMNSSGFFRITDDGDNVFEGKLQVWPEPYILTEDRNYKSNGDLGRYED